MIDYLKKLRKKKTFKSLLTHKMIAIPLTLVLVCWFYFFILFLPQARRLEAIRTETQEKLSNEQRLTEMIRLKLALSHKMQTVSKNLAAIQRTIPEWSKRFDILREIEEKSHHGINLKVGSIRFVKSEERETLPFRKDYVEILVQGDYRNIANYIHSITNLPNLVTIDKIDIERKETTGELNAKLLVILYFRRNPASQSGDDEIHNDKEPIMRKENK